MAAAVPQQIWEVHDMSREVLDLIMLRAATDANFRTLLRFEPLSALSGYPLTEEERAAIVADDPDKLMALGVDEWQARARSGSKRCVATCFTL